MLHWLEDEPVGVERAQRGSAGVVGGTDPLHAGLHAPDLPGVLGNGAVAGELPTASDVVDHLPGPLRGVLPGGPAPKLYR